MSIPSGTLTRYYTPRATDIPAHFCPYSFLSSFLSFFLVARVTRCIFACSRERSEIVTVLSRVSLHPVTLRSTNPGPIVPSHPSSHPFLAPRSSAFSPIMPHTRHTRKVSLDASTDYSKVYIPREGHGFLPFTLAYSPFPKTILSEHEPSLGPTRTRGRTGLSRGALVTRGMDFNDGKARGKLYISDRILETPRV